MVQIHFLLRVKIFTTKSFRDFLPLIINKTRKNLNELTDR